MSYLGTGAMGVAKAALHIDRPSAPTVRHRRALCSRCPANKRSRLGRLCIECDCFIRAKTAVASEHCPRGQW